MKELTDTMFPSGSINHELANSLNLAKLFDFYRLVDNSTHQVLEYSDAQDAPVPNGETCHHIWGEKGPCPNCTSRSCVARHETIIKIMHLNGTFFLIYSTPVFVKGRFYALELIKDVTSSLMVPSETDHDNIEITQVIERFNELAVIDSFTGLYNKNYVANQLQEISDECAKNGEAPTADFIMLDLDNFKDVNDLHGHTIGDDVLYYFAGQLSNMAQDIKDGWAARYGGDEFVLCAPHGLTDDDYKQLKSRTEGFAKHVFQAEDGKFTISASYGVATMKAGESARELIDRADEAMYLMKEEHHSAAE